MKQLTVIKFTPKINFLKFGGFHIGHLYKKNF